MQFRYAKLDSVFPWPLMEEETCQYHREQEKVNSQGTDTSVPQGQWAAVGIPHHYSLH